MQTSELLAELGYSESPNFLEAARFGEALEHAHVFRRAAENFRLHGVYLLRESSKRGQDVSTPVVYVAEADNREEADKIHKNVWNQNIVPFLLVRTPDGIWLYSGFRYDWKTIPRSKHREQQGVLEAAIAFNEVARRLSAFCAGAIDDGTLWHARGHQIKSETRVDWRLLDNLAALGKWLHEEEHLEKEIANALIGKFVYLRYLKDRDILSARRLRDWGMNLREVFGRDATLEATQKLIEKVDKWLNGAIFPFPFSGRRAPKLKHVRGVAAIFLGDEASTGQLHLDFQPYDFSYIPIETLSVIYEQFLASEGKDKASGAYYTPIPLVNFMLAELDDYRPLKPGMRVLDPACGSGAFLVQCYRRLIERHLQEDPSQPLRPTELRDLLIKHIFGVDRDPNACRVAVLSLVLTMLDYVKPPDLQSTPTFKLPDLHNRNIFHGDFFDPQASWCSTAPEEYHWILGNPPWKPAKSEDRFAIDWIETHAQHHPVVSKQIAEAFTWKASTHLEPGGIAGLLLPSMTLFKQDAAFRKAFFHQVEALTVANFSNLRRDLFADRVEEPAAAIFFTRRADTPGREDVLVYSPLLVNQELGRPTRRETRALKRKETWAISLNSGEIRQVSYPSIASGASLPWKTAMWGSHRDLRLVTRMEKCWPRLRQVTHDREILIHPGLELRDESMKKEPIDPIPEIAGRPALLTTPLRNCGRLYSLPPLALKLIEPHMAFVRRGRGRKPLAVCNPPHIIVSGARTFAIFTDDFVVIPSRQIGVAGDASQRAFLIALSLYLNSDFAQYYEFFRSPQGGVREGRSTLGTLDDLPCPINDLDASQLRDWGELHSELSAISFVRWPHQTPDIPLFDDSPGRELQIERLGTLESALNDKVSNLLGLEETERWLIHDLVHIRRYLTDGNVGGRAVQTPTTEELTVYAETLRRSLNDFVQEEQHFVTIAHDRHSGLIEVTLVAGQQRGCPVQVYTADDIVGSELATIRTTLLAQASQWIYFDRNLHIYRDDRTYLLKPMQRVGWTRSQALMDAEEILASALAPEGN